MAINNFNSLLRQCVTAMHTEKGIKTVECLAGYSLSVEAREILKDLVTLVMETDICSADTKAFLADKYRSCRNDVDSNGCAKNIRTSRSRVFYDLSKLRSALGEDALEIIVKQSRSDLTRYKNKVQELLHKYKEKSLLEGFTIKQPEFTGVVKSLREEDFEILFDLAKHFSKKGKMLGEFNLTPEMIGYIRFLENHKDALVDIERERYDQLSAWLN